MRELKGTKKEIQNQFLSEKKHPLDYSGKLS